MLLKNLLESNDIEVERSDKRSFYTSISDGFTSFILSSGPLNLQLRNNHKALIGYTNHLRCITISMRHSINRYGAQ